MIINSVDKNKHYDIVIIGSGPAGISTALTIANRSPLKIALVESGDVHFNSSIHRLSDVSASGRFAASYYPTHAQRVFGGTSSVWAGFCTTMEERAFDTGEWPLPYSELQQYYLPAGKILDLPEQAWQQPLTPLSNSSCIVYKPFYLSPPVRFNNKYLSLIQKHERIDLIFRHTCVGLEKNNNTVKALRLMPSPSKQAPYSSVEIKAKQFVFACGGIGNAKLLLNAELAKNSPVGKFFMEHPHLYSAVDLQLDQETVQQMTQTPGRRVHALQLSNDMCRQSSVLGMSVQFDNSRLEEMTLLGRKKNSYKLSANIRAEMRPQSSNNISLGQNRDSLEQKVPHINFQFNYAQVAHKTWDIFAKELVTSGIGRASIIKPYDNKMAGGGHYMGSTRMGLNEKDSVVDKDCKLHACDNLYLAGSSIFPAAGVANPTYTIVAFAVRLGEHLVKQVEA